MRYASLTSLIASIFASSAFAADVPPADRVMPERHPAFAVMTLGQTALEAYRVAEATCSDAATKNAAADAALQAMVEAAGGNQFEAKTTAHASAVEASVVATRACADALADYEPKLANFQAVYNAPDDIAARLTAVEAFGERLEALEAAGATDHTEAVQANTATGAANAEEIAAMKELLKQLCDNLKDKYGDNCAVLASGDITQE